MRIKRKYISKQLTHIHIFTLLSELLELLVVLVHKGQQDRKVQLALQERKERQDQQGHKV
jgi:hypothetical protein